MTRHLTRRQALAHLGAGAAALTAAGSLAPGCSLLRPQPNVILIVADDLGSVDLNCYGSTDLITPVLDGLARDGLRFTQFYVTAPACLPSRASLLSGRHFLRGVQPGSGLAPTETTVAEMLKGVGYRTACIGKWHLGKAYPQDQGFDEFFGHVTGCLDNYSHYYYWGGPERHVLLRDREPWYEPGAYYPDLLVREATRFIDADPGSPFFLYLPLNLPHYPVQPDPAWRQRYSHVDNPARREYGAHVSTMDDRIGQILSHLESRGLRDNTLVLFLSDHGHSEEERSGGGGSAGYLKGGKTTLWEGGIRVPFLMSWPAGLPAGQLRTQPVTSLDVLPTLADLCGAPLPETVLDGSSLADLCADADAGPPHHVLHWIYENMWAIREGPWKLVGETGGGKEDTFFLANIALDAGERTDQQATQPQVAQRLLDLHNQWIGYLRTDANVRQYWMPEG